MDIKIRQETENDHQKVFRLIEEAFKDEPYSDYKEQFLVERLRNAEAFISELSLVGELENTIVGYILLTKIKIKIGDKEITSLALAPVAVLPRFQGRGIGGKLIENAHKIAADKGYQSIVLVGHEKYYPRFGYRPADEFGLSIPFDVPKENCMAIELKKGALENIGGEIIYPKEFYE